MKKTFVDVMLELPVDTTLRDFLTSHGLPVPDEFAWDDTPQTSQFLVEAIKVWPDVDVRDRMAANLIAGVQLGDAAGKQAMFEAAVADGAALSDVSFVVREGARLAARSGKERLDQTSLLSALRSSPAREREGGETKRRIGFV